MNAAKQDAAGVSRSIPLTGRAPRASLLTDGFEVSTKGVTFSSPTFLAPFTEVQVRVQLGKGSPATHFVNCSGVVVDCHGTRTKNLYEVAVAFVNLPKTIEDELRQAQRTLSSRALTTPATKAV